MKLITYFLLVGFILLKCDANSVQSFAKHHHRETSPVFQEEYFDQLIDHFNFNSHGNQTYKQRYLITCKNLVLNCFKCYFSKVMLTAVALFLYNL